MYLYDYLKYLNGGGGKPSISGGSYSDLYSFLEDYLGVEKKRRPPLGLPGLSREFESGPFAGIKELTDEDIGNLYKKDESFSKKYLVDPLSGIFGSIASTAVAIPRMQADLAGAITGLDIFEKADQSLLELQQSLAIATEEVTGNKGAYTGALIDEAAESIVNGDPVGFAKALRYLPPAALQTMIEIMATRGIGRVASLLHIGKPVAAAMEPVAHGLGKAFSGVFGKSVARESLQNALVDVGVGYAYQTMAETYNNLVDQDVSRLVALPVGAASGIVQAAIERAGLEEIFGGSRFVSQVLADSGKSKFFDIAKAMTKSFAVKGGVGATEEALQSLVGSIAAVPAEAQDGWEWGNFLEKTAIDAARSALGGFLIEGAIGTGADVYDVISHKSETPKAVADIGAKSAVATSVKAAASDFFRGMLDSVYRSVSSKVTGTHLGPFDPADKANFSLILTSIKDRKFVPTEDDLSVLSGVAKYLNVFERSGVGRDWIAELDAVMQGVEVLPGRKIEDIPEDPALSSEADSRAVISEIVKAGNWRSLSEALIKYKNLGRHGSGVFAQKSVASFLDSLPAPNEYDSAKAYIESAAITGYGKHMNSAVGVLSGEIIQSPDLAAKVIEAYSKTKTPPDMRNVVPFSLSASKLTSWEMPEHWAKSFNRAVKYFFDDVDVSVVSERQITDIAAVVAKLPESSRRTRDDYVARKIVLELAEKKDPKVFEQVNIIFGNTSRDYASKVVKAMLSSDEDVLGAIKSYLFAGGTLSSELLTPIILSAKVAEEAPERAKSILAKVEDIVKLTTSDRQQKSAEAITGVRGDPLGPAIVSAMAKSANIEKLLEIAPRETIGIFSHGTSRDVSKLVSAMELKNKQLSVDDFYTALLSRSRPIKAFLRGKLRREIPRVSSLGDAATLIKIVKALGVEPDQEKMAAAIAGVLPSKGIDDSIGTGDIDAIRTIMDWASDVIGAFERTVRRPSGETGKKVKLPTAINNLKKAVNKVESSIGRRGTAVRLVRLGANRSKISEELRKAVVPGGLGESLDRAWENYIRYVRDHFADVKTEAPLAFDALRSIAKFSESRRIWARDVAARLREAMSKDLRKVQSISSESWDIVAESLADAAHTMQQRVKDAGDKAIAFLEQGEVKAAAELFKSIGIPDASVESIEKVHTIYGPGVVRRYIEGIAAIKFEKTMAGMFNITKYIADNTESKSAKTLAESSAAMAMGQETKRYVIANWDEQKVFVGSDKKVRGFVPQGTVPTLEISASPKPLLGQFSTSEVSEAVEKANEAMYKISKYIGDESSYIASILLRDKFSALFGEDLSITAESVIIANKDIDSLAAKISAGDVTGALTYIQENIESIVNSIFDNMISMGATNAETMKSLYNGALAKYKYFSSMSGKGTKHNLFVEDRKSIYDSLLKLAYWYVVASFAPKERVGFFPEGSQPKVAAADMLAAYMGAFIAGESDIGTPILDSKLDVTAQYEFLRSGADSGADARLRLLDKLIGKPGGKAVHPMLDGWFHYIITDRALSNVVKSFYKILYPTVDTSLLKEIGGLMDEDFYKKFKVAVSSAIYSGGKAMEYVENLTDIDSAMSIADPDWSAMNMLPHKALTKYFSGVAKDIVLNQSSSWSADEILAMKHRVANYAEFIASYFDKIINGLADAANMRAEEVAKVVLVPFSVEEIGGAIKHHGWSLSAGILGNRMNVLNLAHFTSARYENVLGVATHEIMHAVTNSPIFDRIISRDEDIRNAVIKALELSGNDIKELLVASKGGQANPGLEELIPMSSEELLSLVESSEVAKNVYGGELFVSSLRIPKRARTAIERLRDVKNKLINVSAFPERARQVSEALNLATEVYFLVRQLNLSKVIASKIFGQNSVRSIDYAKSEEDLRRLVEDVSLTAFGKKETIESLAQIVTSEISREVGVMYLTGEAPVRTGGLLDNIAEAKNLFSRSNEVGGKRSAGTNALVEALSRDNIDADYLTVAGSILVNSPIESPGQIDIMRPIMRMLPSIRAIASRKLSEFITTYADRHHMMAEWVERHAPEHANELADYMQGLYGIAPVAAAIDRHVPSLYSFATGNREVVSPGVKSLRSILEDASTIFQDIVRGGRVSGLKNAAQAWGHFKAWLAASRELEVYANNIHRMERYKNDLELYKAGLVQYKPRKPNLVKISPESLEFSKKIIQITESLYGDHMASFELIADELINLWAFPMIVGKIHKVGMISDAQYEAIRASGKRWVPFIRLADELFERNEDPVLLPDGSMIEPLKELKADISGGIVDPIEGMIRRATAALFLTEYQNIKNRIGEILYSFPEIEKNHDGMYLATIDGKPATQHTIAEWRRHRDPFYLFAVWRNGTANYIAVDDKHLAVAFMRANNTDTKVLGSFFAAMKDFVEKRVGDYTSRYVGRPLVTSISFIWKMTLMDLFPAVVRSKHGLLPTDLIDGMIQSFGSVFPSVAEMYPNLFRVANDYNKSFAQLSGRMMPESVIASAASDIVSKHSGKPSNVFEAVVKDVKDKWAVSRVHDPNLTKFGKLVEGLFFLPGIATDYMDKVVRLSERGLTIAEEINDPRIIGFYPSVTTGKVYGGYRGIRHRMQWRKAKKKMAKDPNYIPPQEALPEYYTVATRDADTRRISLDFGARGSSHNWLNGDVLSRVYVFWSPMMQDFVSSMRIIKNAFLPTASAAQRRRAYSMILKAIFFLTIPAMFQAAIYWDDDDWWKESWFERTAYIHFSKDSMGRWFRIPAGVSFLNVIFRDLPMSMIFDYADKDPMATRRMLEKTFDSMPFGLPGSVMLTAMSEGTEQALKKMFYGLAPSFVIRPGIALAMNYDGFYNREISMKVNFNPELPQYIDQDRYGVIQGMLGRFMEISPAQADYIIKHVFPGSLYYPIAAANVALSGSNQREDSLHERAATSTGVTYGTRLDPWKTRYSFGPSSEWVHNLVSLQKKARMARNSYEKAMEIGNELRAKEILNEYPIASDDLFYVIDGYYEELRSLLNERSRLDSSMQGGEEKDLMMFMIDQAITRLSIDAIRGIVSDIELRTRRAGGGE